MRTPITAAMQTVLKSQLITSSSHLFKMFPEALYRHNVSSMRWAMLGEESDFSFSGGEISMDGGLGRPLTMPRPGCVLLIGVFSSIRGICKDGTESRRTRGRSVGKKRR